MIGLQKLKSVWYVAVRACREKARGLLSQLALAVQSQDIHMLLDGAVHRTRHADGPEPEAAHASSASHGGAGVDTDEDRDPRITEYLRVVGEAHASDHGDTAPGARARVLDGMLRFGSVLQAGLHGTKHADALRASVRRRNYHWRRFRAAGLKWGGLRGLGRVESAIMALTAPKAQTAGGGTRSELDGGGTAGFKHLVKAGGAFVVRSPAGSVFGGVLGDWVEEAVAGETAAGSTAIAAAGRPLGVEPKSKEARTELCIDHVRSRWDASRVAVAARDAGVLAAMTAPIAPRRDRASKEAGGFVGGSKSKWSKRGGKKVSGGTGSEPAAGDSPVSMDHFARDFDCSMDAIKAASVANMLVRLADIQSWLQVPDEAMDQWATLCCGCLCFCFAEMLAGRLSPGMASTYWPRIWDAWLAVSGLSDSKIW